MFLLGSMSKQYCLSLHMLEYAFIFLTLWMVIWLFTIKPNLAQHFEDVFPLSSLHMLLLKRIYRSFVANGFFSLLKYF